MAPEWAKILVPVFLAGQGLLVYWCAGTEHPPAPPALVQFPATLAGWMELHDDPIDQDVVNTLKADRLLSRTYIHREGANPAACWRPEFHQVDQRQSRKYDSRQGDLPFQMHAFRVFKDHHRRANMSAAVFTPIPPRSRPTKV